MDVEDIEALEAPAKIKKPRTEKQIAAFQAAQAKRDANRAQRATEKEQQDAEFQRKLDEKKAKKTASVVRKQEKQLKALDDVPPAKMKKKTRTYTIEISDSDSDDVIESVVSPIHAPVVTRPPPTFDARSFFA